MGTSNSFDALLDTSSSVVNPPRLIGTSAESLLLTVELYSIEHEEFVPSEHDD